MSMKRFSAKLLFQYRLEAQQNLDKMRTCEERIVTFEARSAKEALKIAKTKGRKSESYCKGDCCHGDGCEGDCGQGDGGEILLFEFVGVTDLLYLDQTCGKDEVWYEIKKCLTPMERREKLIPADEKLIEGAF